MSFAIAPAVGILFVGGFTVFDGFFSMNSSDETIKAKEEMPELFEKINCLRDDILIYFRKRDIDGEAWGNNFGSIYSFMVFNEDLVNSIDTDALHFIYKHEIGHIYYNHKVKICLSLILVMVVVMQIAIYVLNHPYSQSSSLIIASVLLCSFQVLRLILKHVSNIVLPFIESQADDFAIEHSTDQELIGGRRLFQAQDESEQDFIEVFTTAYPKKNIRFNDPRHGSSIDRAKKIEQEMEKRKIDVIALDTDSDYIEAKETIKEYRLKCLMHQFKPQIATFDKNCSKFDAAMNDFLEEKLA